MIKVYLFEKQKKYIKRSTVKKGTEITNMKEYTFSTVKAKIEEYLQVSCQAIQFISLIKA